MVCAAAGRGTEVRGSTWTNWAGTRTHRPSLLVRPASLPELVAVVTRAEAERQRVKAVGSSWSYSDVAVASDVDVIVDTQLLDHVIEERVLPFALTDAARARAGLLVHVECGIKIDALNCALAQRNLAMPTLGGANGQSLIGAISTGTHGGDVDRPPIADHVRAIHLVGPGGREWWIERGGDRAITDFARMDQLRTSGVLCADLQVLYDDRTFFAVLVSMGRMGLIYSVVIEAQRAYRLRETRESRPWSGVESVLRSGGLEAPVLQLTRVAGEARPSRFVEIVLNPFFGAGGDRECVITRRWETTEERRPREQSDSMFTALCNQRSIGQVIAPMIPLVHAAMMAAHGLLLLIPFIGGFLFGLATGVWVALIAAMTALAAGTADADLATTLARVCTLAARLGQSWIVRDLVGAIVQQIRGPLPGGFVVDDSFKIMTNQRDCPQIGQGEPLCMRQIDGLEFAFHAGAGQTRYLDFINRTSELLADLINRNEPAGAALSLRFSGRSEALLAMQQFSMTCSIEVIALRGLPGSETFLRRVQELALEHGGIPHWGLIHELTEAQVYRLYGDNHTAWRRVLGRLIDEGHGRAETFSTTFSRARGLEPMWGCVLPAPLANLVLAVLRALARIRR